MSVLHDHIMGRLGLALVVLGACGFRPAPAAAGDDDAAVADTVTDTIDAPIDAPSLQDGLVAWYRMESIISSTAADATGHGHNAKCVQCPTIVGGHLGNGFSFNGTTRFDVVNDGSFDLPNGFTVATWVNFSVQSGGYNCPVGKIEDATNLNTWQLCWVSAPAWAYYSVHDTTSGFDVFIAAPAPTTHVWYHAAITWDGAVKKLYVNGAVIGSQATPGMLFAASGALTFGADTDNGSQASPLDGIMDDLRIYDHVLGDAQISALAMQ